MMLMSMLCLDMKSIFVLLVYHVCLYSPIASHSIDDVLYSSLNTLNDVLIISEYCF